LLILRVWQFREIRDIGASAANGLREADSREVCDPPAQAGVFIY
jgi:hypothetical protein